MSDATNLAGLPGWLFCPADRPDRYQKAADAADVVILDLEDAVRPADKDDARKALLDVRLDPKSTVVRVNPGGTTDQRRDLEAISHTDYTQLMLAKAESPAQVLELDGFQVVALVETPLGVIKASDIAQADNVVGMMWGAEDLIASIGGGSSRKFNGSYRDVARHARASVLLAASAYGRFALDAVHLDIKDVEGLTDEARDAAASGFSGTVCIHPTQVDVVRTAFRPTESQIGWAQRVLAAAQGERGVFSFEGKMVDSPVLRHAEQLCARAGL
ncbi:CoA ester lyase [Saxibacter everestensis]|uniref:CoA ester lyase n=1 Tax=Saxibacter everestensis TaxID=2909229 RepID=A0ABY8QPW7_9MICO|nr:CoA ester lyase [Brevibacteriaceae bacterium ZFBP1038]